MPKPWERQEGETPKAFYAFTLYRDMGHERSHSKVVQAYSKGKRLDALIQRWSKKHDWVKRTTAYDDYLDAVRRKEQEQAIKDMRDRHTKIAMGLQGKGATKLLKKDYIIKSDRDAIHAIKEGAMLERLSRGEATEKIEAQLEQKQPFVVKLWKPKKDADSKE